MCVVSMIMDHSLDKIKRFYPWVSNPDASPWEGTTISTITFNPPTRQEFDALKKEIEELKLLIKKAVEYDKNNNQKDCENASKMELLKKLAEMVGVDLKDIKE
jgi:hypothetical protein